MAEDAADAAAADDGAIVVFGKVETRQVQEVSAPAIAILTPGTSRQGLVRRRRHCPAPR